MKKNYVIVDLSLQAHKDDLRLAELVSALMWDVMPAGNHTCSYRTDLLHLRMEIENGKGDRSILNPFRWAGWVYRVTVMRKSFSGSNPVPGHMLNGNSTVGHGHPTSSSSVILLKPLSQDASQGLLYVELK